MVLQYFCTAIIFDTMKQRNEYFDFIRGIAIIFVVGIHVFTINDSDCTIIQYSNIALRQVFNCAVPLFLAISGYFLSRVNLDTQQQRLLFWKKQIPKVYIPCLIWSIPYIYKSIFVNNFPVINCLILYFLCVFGVFYFIMVIMQCYLLLPYIKCYCTKQGTILLAAVSLLSVFLMNIFYQRFATLPFGLVSTLGWATHWLGFFAIGIYLANFSSREYKLRLPIGILLAGLFLSFFETQIWPETMGERFGYRISAFIYSYGVILLLFSRRIEMLFLNSNSIMGKIISYIGVISFGIYLIHYTLIIIHYKLIEFVPVDNWLVKWFVTLFVSILFIVVTKRLFPKFAKKYLGFY